MAIAHASSTGSPGRMSSDGRFLAVTHMGPGGGVKLYDVARITSSSPSPVQVGQGLRMNLPQGVTLADGGLFIADTNANRVLAWRDASDAYNGRPPDAVLGATDLAPRPPAGRRGPHLKESYARQP